MNTIEEARKEAKAYSDKFLTVPYYIMHKEGKGYFVTKDENRRRRATVFGWDFVAKYLDGEEIQ